MVNGTSVMSSELFYLGNADMYNVCIYVGMNADMYNVCIYVGMNADMYNVCIYVGMNAMFFFL